MVAKAHMNIRRQDFLAKSKTEETNKDLTTNSDRLVDSIDGTNSSDKLLK